MKKLLSILLVLAMVVSLGVTAFAEGEKDEPDLKTFLSELAEKDKVTEEDLSELLTILGNRIAEEIGTGLSDAGMKHEITSAVFPIYYEGAETGMDLTLYFLDGVTDLPYIEANDFLMLISEMYDGVKFTISSEGPVVTINRTNDLYEQDIPLTFDFDNDTINFMDYNLFCMKATASTILDFTNLPGFNDAGEPSLLQKVDNGAYARFGDELQIPLADYDIELIQQDGLYLIPLQTISDFITAPAQMSGLYFNGKCVIISEDIRSCLDLYYDAPTGERSEALTKYGYNELCLMLDYLYGMKGSHDIESFDKLFHEVGFDALLKGSEVKQADGAIYRLITDYLDDNHSKWHAFSYLNGPIDYTATGLSRARMGNFRQRQLDARAEYYPDGVPGYEEIGNTAYITFDNFEISVENPDDYYAVEDPMDLPDDTIGLIMKAHAMITREDSPIENVVLDLSSNGGGVTDTAIITIAWFLGEASVGMKDTMTGAICSNTYRADINRDRVFDENDTISDKNLFCLTSSFSFSCANLVPCMFKESGVVTLLGRTSGGGTCTIQPVSSAWGTSFQISGNRRTSFMKNGSFYDIDRGADPDHVFTTLDQYYDRAALTDYINSLCWGGK